MVDFDFEEFSNFSSFGEVSVFNTSSTLGTNNLNEDYYNDSLMNESYYNCAAPMTPFRSQHLRTSIYSVYTLIFIISVIGNGIVCYIVIATPRMRTVTNYFIANLAIGDMLITIMCVPFTSIQQVQQYWPFYNILCPVSSAAQAVSVFVSTYTLVAISVDRYVAIMWPLQPRLSKKTTAFVIVAVWLFAMFTTLPIPIVSKVVQPHEYYIVCDKYICREDWAIVGEEYAPSYSKILLVLQFVAPVSVLIFTYTSIGIVIWCHRIPGEAEDGRDLRIARSKRKMIKMMVAVVLVYTICWLPINIYLLMHDMKVEMPYEELIWLASHSLAMSHPCYNPLIYCYMNNRFRQGFAQIFGTLLPCCGSLCDTTDMNTNGRTRTSFPLTSVGGTDSTILHRNNTCTTYISARRRTSNSLGGSARSGGSSIHGGGGGSGGGGSSVGNGTMTGARQRSTKIQFSGVDAVELLAAPPPLPPPPPPVSMSDRTHDMPPVRCLSLMRSGGGTGGGNTCAGMPNTGGWRSMKPRFRRDSSGLEQSLFDAPAHNCQKV